MTAGPQNPYAPPAGEGAFHPGDDVAGPIDVDQQLEAIRPTAALKAAVGCVAISGVLAALAALQLWDAVILFGVVRFVPYALAVVGIASIVLSLKLYRQRVWAAVTALVLWAVSALGCGLWFLLSASSGFVSLIALLLPLAGALSATLSAVALGGCRRTAAARRRLAAHGLDVDF